MTVLPFPVQPEPDPEHHDGARGSDPETTWKAARINQRYRSQLRFNMLLAHGRAGQNVATYQGFTSDELAIHMNLAVPPNGGSSKMCYWKRHSELVKEYGFCFVPHNQWGRALERALPGGEPQDVVWINDRGMAHLDEVLSQYPHGEELWDH